LMEVGEVVSWGHGVGRSGCWGLSSIYLSGCRRARGAACLLEVRMLCRPWLKPGCVCGCVCDVVECAARFRH